MSAFNRPPRTIEQQARLDVLRVAAGISAVIVAASALTAWAISA